MVLTRGARKAARLPDPVQEIMEAAKKRASSIVEQKKGEEREYVELSDSEDEEDQPEEDLTQKKKEEKERVYVEIPDSDDEVEKADDNSDQDEALGVLRGEANEQGVIVDEGQMNHQPRSGNGEGAIGAPTENGARKRKGDQTSNMAGPMKHVVRNPPPTTHQVQQSQVVAVDTNSVAPLTPEQIEQILRRVRNPSPTAQQVPQVVAMHTNSVPPLSSAQVEQILRIVHRPKEDAEKLRELKQAESIAKERDRVGQRDAVRWQARLEQAENTRNIEKVEFEGRRRNYHESFRNLYQNAQYLYMKMQDPVQAASREEWYAMLLQIYGQTASLRNRELTDDAHEAFKETALRFEREETKKANDRAIAARMAHLQATQEVDDHPLSQERRYSRACAVCLSDNPGHRACMTRCGHLVCYLCAQRLPNVADEDTEVNCPKCGLPSDFVKIYEDELENRRDEGQVNGLAARLRSIREMRERLVI